MAQRYVLSPLNTSNANNMSRGDDSILSKHSSRKELNSSMHSLSRTKSPTRLSSKAGNDPHRSVPVEKYEQLVIQCNELTKAASLLRVERDQYLKGYHDLKFISEREKIQLCQAFEELKVSYIQLQNKLQATTQENSMRRTPSSIEKKLSSEVEEGPASSLYTLKEQYYLSLQENKNMKFQLDALQKELADTRISLNKSLKDKYEIAHQLETTTSALQTKLNEGKKLSTETLRQELHRQSQDRYVLGLDSAKNLNESTKISILMEENHNLIIWKQNLENYYLAEIKKLNETIQSLASINQGQESTLQQNSTLINKLESHLEAVTFQNDKIQERSRVVESENGKLRAESMEVKQKASEEYQSKIAEILGKAFNLSTQ